MVSMKRSIACVVAAAAAFALQSVATAGVVFSGSGVNPLNGNNALSGSVEFSVSGNALIVTITNTATSDVLVPSDVLTAAFWTMDIGSASLTRASGVLAPGSSVFYDPDGQPAGGVIGGEWAYRSGLSFAGSTFGISSTGINLFGPGDRFPGPDLQPPTSPNGLEYGLLSAGDNAATGNSGVLNSGGLIKNSVVFTLTGLPVNFSLSSISNVQLQYGTDVSEPRIPAVPTPGAAAVLALGGLVMNRRRRR